MLPQKKPIYCRCCGKLALANLGVMPLCPECLAKAVNRSSDLTDTIRPLAKTFAPIGNVHCRIDTPTAAPPLKAAQGHDTYNC